MPKMNSGSKVPTTTQKALDAMGFSPPISFAEAKRVKGQPGLYAIRFQNGHYYLGQSINLGKRLSDHDRRWGSIVEIRLRRLSKQQLNSAEKEAVERFEKLKVPLRNTMLLSGVPLSRRLKALASSYAFERWARFTSTKLPAGRKKDLSTYAERQNVRWQVYRSHAFSRDATRLFGKLLRAGIPMARRTETTSWCATCMPTWREGMIATDGYLAWRLNVARVEVACFWPGNEEHQSELTLYLSEEILRDSGVFRASAINGVAVTWLKHRIASGGVDQVAVAVSGVDDAMKFLAVPVIVRALRRYVLNQMSKHPAFWTKAHCPQLVDAALK
jgi:predicted GIY-YIG superfamily endonuclease